MKKQINTDNISRARAHLAIAGSNALSVGRQSGQTRELRLLAQAVGYVIDAAELVAAEVAAIRDGKAVTPTDNR